MAKKDEREPSGVLDEIKEDLKAAEEDAENSDDKIELIPPDQVLPETIPVLPLKGRPFFPGIHIPLEVENSDLPAVEYSVDFADHTIGLVMMKDPNQKVSAENLCKVGVAARILNSFEDGDSNDISQVLIACLERFEIVKVHETAKGLQAQVKYFTETENKSSSNEIKAFSLSIISSMRDLMKLNPLQSEAIKLFLKRSSLDNPGQLADFAATLTTAEGHDLQKVLEAFDLKLRIERALLLLKKEVEISKIQNRIVRQIENKMSDQRRDFFLKEQLKAIKKELGLEKEGKETEIEKFQERIQKLELNEEARQTIDDEMEKFSLLEPMSPEYTVSRNYLDWLTILPWGKTSKDNYNLKRAARILDRDHYGLKDVKARILEFIAVGKMKGGISGSIICLVGPPGVGKTSVGKSIASALGRKFYRFSLGGMRDEAEIKGHRRTYIGAMPGKILQAIKTTGTSNSVIMLDEIDKIGASFRGDPASALLEVLDPEQNHAFRDHYLDVPFNLSEVLFITTANLLDTIPSALLDRMEVIRLSGYVMEEKLEIASRFLLPRAMVNHGLNKDQIAIRKDALRHIINDYAREAGVRSLENQIKKIMRKAALSFARGGTEKIVVSGKSLKELLGMAIFTDEELLENRPGIVNGLAWTSLGGATLQIEATAMTSKRKGIKQTGQLGDVMVESSEIAYSFVMGNLEKFGKDPAFFDNNFVHLHVPAGATPKDGPSAGVTMATALLSLVLNKPVTKGLAMTGELTLTGRVLSIGGVKEKIIAAKRAGLKTLIFPEGNRKDIGELDGYLTDGLNIQFAREFDDVYRLAMAGGDN
ncbi:MAG: endopeptidase La [Acidobacteriota bacterium]